MTGGAWIDRRPRAGRARAEAGFTLVELVLVVVVASVAMFPIAMMFATATADAPEAQIATQAVFLAQERIEAVLADRAAPSRGFAWITSANYPPEPTIPGFPGFSRTVSVSADSTWQGVTFRHVRVTVTHGAIGSVSLDTWVTP